MERQELHQKLTNDLTKLWKGQRENYLWFEYRSYQVTIAEHSEGWEYSITDKNADHDPDKGSQFEDEVEGGVIGYLEMSPSDIIINVLDCVDNLKKPNGYEISNLPNGTVAVIPMTNHNSVESVKEYAVKRYKASDPVVKEIFSWDYDDDHQRKIAQRIQHWF